MFLLDSNVFIEASRTYYSPKIAPTFWDWLIQKHDEGLIASIPEVKQEILNGKQGHLTLWAEAAPESFWIPTDDRTVVSMTRLSSWTMDPSHLYTAAARSEFLNIADYFLVAAAHAGGHTVVTREQSAAESKKKVKIPDACLAMGVPFQDPFVTYEQLALRLTSQSP